MGIEAHLSNDISEHPGQWCYSIPISGKTFFHPFEKNPESLIEAKTRLLGMVLIWVETISDEIKKDREQLLRKTVFGHKE